MTCYQQTIDQIKTYTAKITQAIPETMRAFYALSRASSTAGALDTKTKELIALAIGVTSHCQGCIAFHTRAALQAGANPAEIMEALSVAIAMGGGPALMYASDAVAAMEEFQNRRE
ncbi:carboxymuconolactone decarboxylase family protein [Gloeomargarita sp.]